MKKIALILVALMACSSAFAQFPYKPHDTIWYDSTRYMVIKIDEHKYTMVEYTPVDTLNWNNTKTITYNSPWFRFQNTFDNNDGFGMDAIIGSEFQQNKCVGVGILVEGIYFDWLTSGYSIDHGATRHTYEPGTYSDGRSTSWHVGYYFPLYNSGHTKIRIAPLIGEYHREYGVTTIYRYNWGWCRGSFSKTGEIMAIDYGANLRYDYGCEFVTFSLSLGVTRHYCTFGIGCTFNLSPLF